MTLVRDLDKDLIAVPEIKEYLQSKEEAISRCGG